MQLLDATIATPIANNLVFLKGVMAGSATSSNGGGVAMQFTGITPGVGSATSSIQYAYGFSNVALTSLTTTVSYTQPTNGCYVAATSTINWRLVCTKASVQTIADTGFATSTQAFKTLLVVDSNGASVYFNNSNIAAATIASANLPVVPLRPFIGVGTTAGSNLTIARFGVANFSVWSQDKY
jgi:hypothetical protein